MRLLVGSWDITVELAKIQAKVANPPTNSNVGARSRFSTRRVEPSSSKQPFSTKKPETLSSAEQKRAERHTEMRETAKSFWFTEAEQEKAISEVLRDNLTYIKARFPGCYEAREAVDLTAPGDIIQKRHQIHQNLRANKQYWEQWENEREEFSGLTDVFIHWVQYMQTLPIRRALRSF